MPIRMCKNPGELKVGDKITTDFHYGEEGVVRTITEIYDNVQTGSRRGIVADAGEPCPCCGRPFGTPVCASGGSKSYIDAYWAVKVEENE